MAMCHFMTGDICLVVHQIYGQTLSFLNKVMVCQSFVNGVSLSETLFNLTTDDIPKDGSSNTAMDTFLKTINTSCKALGHTSKAVRAVRKIYLS